MKTDLLTKIKIARKAQNYTQEDIANLLNLSKTTYGDIERGRINLKANDLITLISFLKININDDDLGINLYKDEEDLILKLAERIKNRNQIKNIENYNDSLVVNDNHGEVYYKSNNNKKN